MKKALGNSILICISIIGLLSSCISSEETNYIQPIPTDPTDPGKYKYIQFEEYKLAVRDVVTCAISTNDEETRSLFQDVVSGSSYSGIPLNVYEDSTVILPFFGTIKVAGLTIQEAESRIEEMLQESILDAQVKLSLANNFFYIYANERQGQYSVYKENMTIYQALAISGQTTERMDLSMVKIVRKDEQGQDIVKTFDLRTKDVIESEFYYIKPNDLIYFSTNKNAFFNVTSVGSFIQTVMTPLTFLFFVSTYKFR